MTVIPVIGVPISGAALDGMDALLSIVQMPSGIPVATVAINGSKNVLVISSLANDIEFANNNSLTSCLVYFGSEIDLAMEMGPTHVINKTSQLDSIIIE